MCLQLSVIERIRNYGAGIQTPDLNSERTFSVTYVKVSPDSWVLDNKVPVCWPGGHRFDSQLCRRSFLWWRIFPWYKWTGFHLGGLGITCSLRDPRFVGSNPAEVDVIFSRRKNVEHQSSGRDFKPRVPSLRFQAR